MITGMEFVKQSLETNLFFLRIIKEHLIFASAALTHKDSGLVPQLMNLKCKFENLLIQTILLANGNVRPEAVRMGDIITPYTMRAEIVTQQFTGLPINTNITQMEAALFNSSNTFLHNHAIEQAVSMLNQNIIVQLKIAIDKKKEMLNNILACKMFTSMYPAMLEHVTHEAEHYLEHLEKLQKCESLKDGPKTAAKGEEFWNHIMGDHGRFIRGLLDPTEEELINKANGFANEFDELTQAAKDAYDRIELLPEVTKRSMEATTNIRNFKEQGTQGILECKIRSIILPLLSDHVLREANHYLKELQEFKV